MMKKNGKANWIYFLVCILAISNSVDSNSIRPRRHVGLFLKHLQPIIDAEIPLGTTMPPEVDSEVSTMLPENSMNDSDSTSSPMPSSSEGTMEVSSSAATTMPPIDSSSPDAPAASPKVDADSTKSPNDENPTTNPPVDPSPESGNTEKPKQDDGSPDSTSPVSTSPDKSDEKPKDENTTLSPDTNPTSQPGAPSNDTSSSKPNPTSEPDMPAATENPMSPDQTGTPKSMDTESSTPGPGADEKPEGSTSQPEKQESSTTPGNARQPKSFKDLEINATDSSPTDSTDTSPEANPDAKMTTPVSNPNSDMPTTVPSSENGQDMCTTVTPVSETTGKPDDKVAATENPETVKSETVKPETNSTEADSTTQKAEPEDEELAEIAKLLEKLNNQKKALDDQIAQSKDTLASITDVLNNDKDRRMKDVINKAEEEEVQPLAKELHENTTDYDKVLDPAVVYSANETQREAAKEFIIVRIAIPQHFQLMQNYLGLKMASPNVNFKQRLGVIGLFTETHLDCIRNQQNQVRGPLEAMIVKLTCITKSTDPGKIPNDWQPSNYLNRGAQEQIQNCNQPEFFDSTKPYGRYTIIFRRIQDNYQDGLNTFENMQRKFAHRVNQANQEVIKMKEQCERQQQLQLESEQLPPQPPSLTYLPVKSRWNTQDIPAAPMYVPPAGPSGQWYQGQWMPSVQGQQNQIQEYRGQRWG